VVRNTIVFKPLSLTTLEKDFIAQALAVGFTKLLMIILQSLLRQGYFILAWLT